MVAAFPSRIESARLNSDDNTVVLIDSSLSKDQDDLLQLSKAQLRDRLARLQQRLHRAEKTIHLMHDQSKTLSERMQVAHTSATHKRIPEPARQPSTYIIPKRQRSQRFDRATRSIPFYLFMLFLGVGLIAALALIIPTTSAQLGLAHLLMAVLKGIFIAIVISTVGSFALEVSQYHAR